MILYGHKGRSLFREKRHSDVIDCNKISGSKTIHPTEKPVELLEKFIRNNSDNGDIVFDGFMGVGSACLATKNLNRRYIGVELDEEYFKKAVDRLK